MLFYWTGNLLRNTNQFEFIQYEFIKETSRKGNITKVDM